jgi:hypothetical protein
MQPPDDTKSRQQPASSINMGVGIGIQGHTQCLMSNACSLQPAAYTLALALALALAALAALSHSTSRGHATSRPVSPQNGGNENAPAAVAAF